MSGVDWIIEWPDGLRFTGDSAHAVLEQIRQSQWTPTVNIKSALSDRAWSLARVVIDDHLEDAEFLRACQAAGLVTIINPPTEGDSP